MPSLLLGQKAQEKLSPQPTPVPTSSGLRELKESAVVSEEMDSEWRRLGPAEASETFRERMRGQDEALLTLPHRDCLCHTPSPAQICLHAPTCSLSLKPSPLTSHHDPKPHPDPGQL